MISRRPFPARLLVGQEVDMTDHLGENEEYLGDGDS